MWVSVVFNLDACSLVVTHYIIENLGPISSSWQEYTTLSILR